MSRKSKLTYEEKISAVEDYKKEKGNYANIAKNMGFQIYGLGFSKDSGRGMNNGGGQGQKMGNNQKNCISE